MCFYTYKNILILVKNLLKLVDSAHEKLLRSFLLNYRTRINLNGDCYKCIVWRAWFGAVIYINNTNYDACRWFFFQYRVIVVTYELNFIFCKEKSKRTRDFTTPLDHRLHPAFHPCWEVARALYTYTRGRIIKSSPPDSKMFSSLVFSFVYRRRLF